MAQLLESSNDQHLLVLMRASNAVERQQGWDAWYRRDAPTIQSYIKRRAFLLRCMEHSEDILQDCFLIGFKNVSNGNYQEQGVSLCGYLTGIANNLLREVVRLQKREPVTLNEEIEDDLGISPEDSLDRDEIVNKVREACAQRSNVYQRVVKGIYVQGKSSNELAKELGKSAGNIRAIAHRAVREIGHSVAHQHHLQLSANAIRACLEVI